MKFLKDHRVGLIATIGLALVLRIAAVGFLDIKPTSDAHAYMEMATTMLNSGDMDDSLGNVAFYSSGYPLFLIPFFALFQSNPETAQIVNLALGVMTVLLVYLCGAEILPSRRWAIVPALIWATYPPALVYTEYIFKENLLAPLLLLQMYLLIRYANARRKCLTALAIGLVFGLEMLVGAAVLFTGALAALVVAGFGQGWRLRSVKWQPALACCFGCALALAPWLSYTTVKLGQPVLTTSGGFNLYLGNNANSTGYYIGIQDTPIASTWPSIRKEKGEIGAMSMLKDMAIQYISENPGKTIVLSLKKVMYFWWPPVHEGKFGNQSILETMMRLVWLFYYTLIMAFALVSLIRLRDINRGPILLLYGTVVLYCAIYAATYVIIRYRLPVMPMMSILATVGLHYTYLHLSAPQTPLISK